MSAGLQEQTTVVELGRGIDRKGQKDLIEGHYDLRDFRFTELGGLRKRGYYEGLSNLGLTTVYVNRLATYRDMPVAIGDGLHRYSDDADQWYEANVKGPRTMEIEGRPVLRSDEGANYCDTAAAGDYVCHVWTYVTDDAQRPTLNRANHPDAGDVFVQVEEADSGVVVLGPQKISNLNVGVSADDGGSLSVVAIHESQFVIFGRRASDSELAYAIVTIGASGVTINTVQLVSGFGIINAGTRMFFATVQDGDEIYVARERPAGLQSAVYMLVPNANPATSIAVDSFSLLDDGLRPRAILHDDVNGQVRVAGFADSSHPPDMSIAPQDTWVLSFADGSVPALTGLQQLLHSPILGDVRRYQFGQTGYLPAHTSRFGIVLSSDAGDFYVVWDGDVQPSGPSFGDFALMWARVQSNGTPAGEEDVCYHVALHALPFRPAGGKPIVPVAIHERVVTIYDGGTPTGSDGWLTLSTLQPGGLLIEPGVQKGDGWRYVGNYSLDFGRTQLRNSHSYEAGGRGTGRFVFGAISYEVEPTVGKSPISRAYSVRATFMKPASNPVAVTHANDKLAIQAASVSGFGGLFHVEHTIPAPHIGFKRVYDIVNDPNVDTFQYYHPTAALWHIVAVWRWRDERGNVHRSAPSTPVIGNDEPENRYFTAVSIDAPPPTNWGARTDSDLYIELYCDPPVDSGAAAPIGEFSRYHVARYTDVIDPAAPWQTILLPDPGPSIPPPGTPTELDDDNVPLYTNASVLTAEMAPPMSYISASRQRVFGIEAEDRRKVWYTAPLEEGVAPKWNANLTIRTPHDAGELTALAALDDFAVLFSKRSVFLLEGQGQNRFGAGNPFRLRRLSREIGCVNPQSVVVTDAGVIFESEKGLYLLEQGQRFVFIGAGIERLDRGSIVQASALSKNHEVLFDTDAGETMLFDLLGRNWSVLTHDRGAQTATIWESRHVRYEVAQTGNGLVIENEASGFNVGASLTTAWFKLAGLGGFKRFWRMLLLLRVTKVDTDAPAGRIRVRMGYDHEDEFSSVDTFEFDLDQQDRLDPLRLLTPYVRRQLCQAVRFEITYVPDEIEDPQQEIIRSNVLLSLAGLTLKWGAHRGLARRKPAQQGGL